MTATTNDFFVKTCLTDKVKIQPKYLCKNVSDVIQRNLVNKFEGKCSYHGYIKTGSIKLSKVSLGQVQAFSLNGDIIYNVSYYAEVCNPSIGSIVKAKVVNMNKFGILAECGITLDGGYVPILEIIVAKNTVEISSEEVDFDAIKVDEDLFIEILGKKYELNDKKISVVGKIIQTKSEKNILDDEAEMEGGYVSENDEVELSDDEDDEEQQDENQESGEESEDESDNESFHEEFFSENDDVGSDGSASGDADD